MPPLNPDQQRLKRNRNAAPGQELPDLVADETRAKEVQDRIAAQAARRQKRRISQRERKNEERKERMQEAVLQARREGRTWHEIELMPSMPSRTTLWEWRHEDAEWAEDLRRAWEDAVREYAERALRIVDAITGAPGLTAEPLDRSDRAIKSAAKHLEPRERILAEQAHGRLMVEQARAVAAAYSQRAHRIIDIASRVLPAEWGRDREQDAEVIVYEVPGGWMSDPATAGLDDPDGQGPEAAAAAKRMQEMRDVGSSSTA